MEPGCTLEVTRCTISPAEISFQSRLSTSHPGGTPSGDRLNFVVAGGQVVGNLLGRQLGIVGMGVGVVHHLMSRIVEGLDRLRIFVHPLPHHEKGGLHGILGQDIDQLLCILVAPG